MTSTNANECMSNFASRDEENTPLLCKGGDRSYSYSYPHLEEIPDIMQQEASSFIRGENQIFNRKTKNDFLLRDPHNRSSDEFLSSHVSQSPIFLDREEFESPLMRCSSAIDKNIVPMESNIEASPSTPLTYYDALLPCTTTQRFKERSNTVTFMDQDVEKSNPLDNSMDSFINMNKLLEPTNSELGITSPKRARTESIHSFTSFIYDDEDNDDFLDELLINDWWDDTDLKANDSSSVFYGESSVDEISNFFASCGTKSDQRPVTSTRQYDRDYDRQCQDLMKCMRRTQKSRSKVVTVKENILKHHSLRAKYSFRRELANLGLNTVNTDASRNKVLGLHRNVHNR